MPYRLTLARMAQLIAGRRLSPVELVESIVRQIERNNPRLNAFIEVYEEQALQSAARLADQLVRSGPAGPLHGVPVTVKDSLDIAGRVTYCGSLLRRGLVAEAHAAAVDRLLAAGAILLGKTSTPEFLYNYETDNRLIGRTSNPWNAEWTAGGSSGGEAAAIASLMSPGGIGSDGGGSIREPAHFCGICGLKPTPGRISSIGHWPPIVEPAGFLGVVGPMARAVGDVEILFEVLAAPDPRDPYAHPPVQYPPFSSRVRFAVLRQPGQTGIQARCLAAVDHAVRLLREAGREVVEFDFRLLAGAHELWRFLFIDWSAPGVRAFIAGRESDCCWSGLELPSLVERQAPPTAEQLASVRAHQARMRSELIAWLGCETLVLMPGFGVTAFPHRQRRFPTPAGEIDLLDAVRTVSPANVLGLPSLSVPVLAGGGEAPAGVQILGPPDSEPLLLAAGRLLEHLRGPLPAPADC